MSKKFTKGGQTYIFDEDISPEEAKSRIAAGAEPASIGKRFLQGFEEINRPVQNLAIAAGRGYTAGLSDRALELASLLGDRLKGGEKSFEDVREDVAADLAERNETPGTGLAEIGALALPGSVFGRAFKGLTLGGKALSKAPFVSKLLSSFKGARPAAELLGRGVRGGGATALHTALTPENEDVGLSANIGGAVDALLPPTLKAGGALVRGGIGLAKSVPRLMRGTPVLEGVSDVFAEKLGKRAVERGVGRLGAERPTAAGSLSKKGMGEIGSAESEAYEAVKGPVFEKFGGKEVSPEQLRKAFFGHLEKRGLTDSKGNIVKEKFDLIFNPQARSLAESIAERLSNIRKNPTLKELSNIVDDIGEIAQFDKGSRSAKNLTFGRLYSEARDNMLDAVESLAGGETKESLRAARSRISEVLGVTKGRAPLGEVLKGAPEEAVRKVSRMEPSEIEKLFKTLPGARAEVRRLVVSDIATSATDPVSGQLSKKAFVKALSKYDPEVLDMVEEGEPSDHSNRRARGSNGFLNLNVP